MRQGSVGTDNAILPLEWFENRLNQVKTELETMYRQFRLSEALKTIYSLIWNDFCSWYLEWVKPGFEQSISSAVYEKTVSFFGELLQLLHPFMPFVTEEIYHQLSEKKDDLCVKQFTKGAETNTAILIQGELLKESISAIRDARIKNNIKNRDAIKLNVQTGDQKLIEAIAAILNKQVNADELNFVKEPVPESIAVITGSNKFYLQAEQELDTTAQKEQLQKDLDYHKGFLLSVEKKLSNERFVQNAKPDVVEAERKKKADAEEKIKALEESLAELG
jgi:valyl-tRNA synthetase